MDEVTRFGLVSSKSPDPMCRVQLREMVRALARGAQSLNSKFLKAMMWKSYHRKSTSSELMNVSVRWNSEERKERDIDGTCWIPHNRTGIYYPKGHETVMEDIPIGAAKIMEVHWFSCSEDAIDHLFTVE
ncbi:hypothetical protein HHK36_013622 [Tetracentron sinense]|uniref:Uncharacterized protein n=1 Tax=Tetracentron sinense TaxID=13715 RepID=A0A834Z4G3_TETSI|nr:hypothetical protein HHK36_013622 [Tetracentron sinense]